MFSVFPALRAPNPCWVSLSKATEARKTESWLAFAGDWLFLLRTALLNGFGTALLGIESTAFSALLNLSAASVPSIIYKSGGLICNLAFVRGSDFMPLWQTSNSFGPAGNPTGPKKVIYNKAAIANTAASFRLTTALSVPAKRITDRAFVLSPVTTANLYDGLWLFPSS